MDMENISESLKEHILFFFWHYIKRKWAKRQTVHIYWNFVGKVALLTEKAA